jgi:threonine/homoserine/homoserine lactone efflux protein
MAEVAWLLFIVASTVLIVTPGQDMMLVMSRSIAHGRAAGVARSLARRFFDGELSNVSNPKIAVFHFAFLPQFLRPGAAPPTLSVFAQSLVFAAPTFLVKGPAVLGAGLLSAWLRARSPMLAAICRSSGAVLVGLGPTLAFERRG